MDIENNRSGEEEYRPSDYDTSSVFEATPTSSKAGTATSSSENNKAAKILEHLKRKNIIIAVGVIIGIFCVYKIIDVLFTPGVPRHQTVAPVQAQMPKPIQQPVVRPNNQEMIATTSVVNRLNSLEQQTNNEQANLQRLSNQVNDLQTSVSNIDAKLSSLTTAVQTVVDTVAREQAAMAAQQAAKKRAAVMAREEPKPIYYVKALVPGRAWLATQSGQTVTVSLGNNLPGYGTVEVIDPNQGTIITSTGAIIGYSSGDS